MSHRPARLLVLLALLAVLTGGCAGTDGAAPDGRYSLSVVTENEHRFAAGEVSVGPLVIAGGDTTLEEGSEHHGTVAVLAGDLTLDGTLDGDLLVLGGAVRLGGKGVVTGDVQRAGGSLERAEGATVRGREQDQADPADLVGEPTAGSTVAGRLVWVALTTLVLAGLAWLLVRLAPRPTRRVEAAATTHPVVSGALGTLVLLTAPALLVSMGFTLVLLPLAIALLLPLAAVVTYGVLGLGLGAGTRLRARIRRQPSAATTAALGTGLLVLALHVVGAVPVIGLVAYAAVGTVGTGAVLLTALGTRAYVPPADPWGDG